MARNSPLSLEPPARNHRVESTRKLLLGRIPNARLHDVALDQLILGQDSKDHEHDNDHGSSHPGSMHPGSAQIIAHDKNLGSNHPGSSNHRSLA